MKFFELVFNPDAPDRHLYPGPNGWKTHLSLLHKNVPVEVQEITYLDLRSAEFMAKNGGNPGTSPAVELPDGSILCDSFRIAEYLESEYPDAPSLFSGSTSKDPAAIAAGKAYAFMMTCGLGDSDPEWAVWMHLTAEDLAAKCAPGPLHDYFVSDRKWGGENAFAKFCAVKREQDLVKRAKANLMPLVKTLKNRPGEFLQGVEPGFVDYVVFGRYAMCRNCNPTLAKEIWEDEAKEIADWVDRLLARYPSVRQHLQPYD
ncbi:hypothetical protein HDU83_005297 [Entophlyctis luteolus]|nr:hypothetical protein HDU82_001633 [Entophlyctis luteolus]KAJ3344190.1 hypothetical protein HDU83_005297 [Entophlyctis luteolus]KAJ3377173.1 hypothetical protein HDU84_008933 [Entophlyctis sp. JEL0112]